MTRARLASLRVLALAGALSSVAAAQSELPAGVERAPDQRDLSEARRFARYVYGSLGIDYSLTTRGFGDELKGEVQTSSTGLYTLKTAELRFLNLWGFETQLDYAATEFLSAVGFEEPKAVAEEQAAQDEATRVLLGVVTPFVANFKLRTSGVYAVYTTHARVSDFSTVTHLGSDGSVQGLAPGSTVAYSTRFILGAAEASPRGFTMNDFRVYVGYTFFDLTSSEWLTIQQENAVFSTLVDTRRRCHAVSLSMAPPNKVEQGLSVYVVANFFFGAGSTSSPWFDSGAFCFGRGGELGVRYLAKNFGLLVGYNIYEYSMLGGDEIDLSRDVALVNRSGEARSAAAGTTWSLSSTQGFNYMGPFLRATFGL